MLLTITFLIVAWLQPAQPTIVTDLQPQYGWSQQLQAETTTGVELQHAQPTIVKTWEL